MVEIIDIKNVDNVCRLCLSTDEPKLSIFDHNDSTILLDKIRSCLAIQITANDKISKLICQSCVKIVTQWHDYKENCIRSQNKLSEWLGKLTAVRIKEEPIDLDSNEEIVEIISNPKSIESEAQEETQEGFVIVDKLTKKHDEIKNEPINDRIMEADSTQKSKTMMSSQKTAHPKKKLRRGPHTHFRGARLFKKKCQHCRIFLHSKWSYGQHMKRFHGSQNDSPPLGIVEDEMIEDVEEEIISMEKDAPLTQVQQNIISQLKTYTCYDCEKGFPDRKSTLNHIRQHMPDLRPYCCIACLTEFPDSSMYKIHCEASFECAMKIALVVPKFGTEKYFVCNMCLKPLKTRQELLNHLSKHSDKQYEELKSSSSTSLNRSPPKLQAMVDKNSIPSPYRDGDPAHNHYCDLCGMIYRYKPNLIKHREACLQSTPELRISYRCVHCGMTYLIFKKFQVHILQEHNKKDYICSKCYKKFKDPNDYLQHHDKEHLKHEDIKYVCALCSQEFKTRVELSEHRNLHLKVKIYSCVICRSMFSSAGSLELHMKDHGIEDLNSQRLNLNKSVEEDEDKLSNSPNKTNECETCGKLFSNMANVKRHIRNVHANGQGFLCPHCPLMLKTKELCNQHCKMVHNNNFGKTSIKCPKCTKSFVFQANLDLHYKNVHENNKTQQNKTLGYDCEICGKSFLEEPSLKIHRSWHSRANSRYSLPNVFPKRRNNNNNDIEGRPAKARKSFPTTTRPNDNNSLQCQVCDLRFIAVDDLRKHLWDVHCSRTKSEKFNDDNPLKCELCTIVLPDLDSFNVHMKWHQANPILNNVQTYSCDVCHKNYSSKKVLRNHKKLHNKVPNVKLQSLNHHKNNYTCTICRKLFANVQSLKRHRFTVHGDTQALNPPPMIPIPSSSNNDKQRTLKMETFSQMNDFIVTGGKKPVMCHVCKKMFPNMSVLYKHKQLIHKATTSMVHNEFLPISSKDGHNLACNICGKEFPGLANLKQHFVKQHKKTPKFKCSYDNCQLGFPTLTSLKNHEVGHASMMYSCLLCDRHVFNRGSLSDHMYGIHKTIYDVDTNTNFHKEIDLSTYVVPGAVGSYCPICKIKYPNNRAMKIHYFKFHEKTRLDKI